MRSVSSFSISTRPALCILALLSSLLPLRSACGADAAIRRTGWSFDKSEIEWADWSKQSEQKAKGGFYGASGWAEYNIAVPAAGWYELWIGGVPLEWGIDVNLDGEPLVAAASGTEADRVPADARKPGEVEYKIANIQLPKGEHKLRLQRTEFPGTLPSIFELRPAAGKPSAMVFAKFATSPVITTGQKAILKMTASAPTAITYQLSLKNEVTDAITPVGNVDFPASPQPVTRELTIDAPAKGLYQLEAQADGQTLRPSELGARWLLVGPAPAAARQTTKPNSLSLAGPFTNGAVLQRQKPLPIWGWAKPGSEVKLSLADQTASATATDDGRWQVTFNPFEAGGPHSMKVEAGTETLNVEDIYFGEVWVCSGQSNMGGPLLTSINGTEAARDAKMPLVRLAYVAESDEPGRVQKVNWMLADSAGDPAKLQKWNSIPFSFGKTVYESINVPIGLVNANRGGTAISSWTSPQAHDSSESFRAFREAFDKYNGKPVRAMRHLMSTISAIQKWKKDPANNKPPEITSPPEFSPNTPSIHYTQLIAPISSLSIRGFVWYQGESDSRMSVAYRERFPLMIQDWRQTFHDPNLPFIYAQIAYGSGKFDDLDPRDVPEAQMREAQFLCQKTPNVAMIVTHDLMQPEDDVHYRNKLPVGQRLGLAALATVYGKKVDYQGPIYRDMKVADGKAIVSFDNADGGIKTDGKPIRGFAIAGEDHKFVWADAKVDGNTITVWSDSVPKPVAVRYCWSGYRAANVFNQAGLPLSTFRTDAWPISSQGAVWSSMK